MGVLLLLLMIQLATSVFEEAFSADVILTPFCRVYTHVNFRFDFEVSDSRKLRIIFSKVLENCIQERSNDQFQIIAGECSDITEQMDAGSYVFGQVDIYDENSIVVFESFRRKLFIFTAGNAEPTIFSDLEMEDVGSGFLDAEGSFVFCQPNLKRIVRLRKNATQLELISELDA